MTFAWPVMLFALLAIPAFVAVYLRQVRTGAKRAAELAAKGFLPNAASIRNRKRRHIPFTLFLVGLALLVFSLSRPQATVSVPSREGIVVLAFDTSSSMRADDLKPTRLDAAKVAARGFVKRQPSSVSIGIVAFGDGGVITQRPTDDREAILAAINRLKPQGATSLGQGIFASLNAINGSPIRLTDSSPTAEVPGASSGADTDTFSVTMPEKIDVDKVKIGYFANAAIVLLSDGENTSDPDPLDLAELASVAGVKIYPIGLGKPEGAVIEVDGFQIATALDEDVLKEIAKTSNGSYFAAEDDTELTRVYGNIDLKWTSKDKKTELTGAFSGASLGLLAVGALLSLKWFGRLV